MLTKHLRTFSFLLALAVVSAGVLTGCDQSEQNVDFEPGDSLFIVKQDETGSESDNEDTPAVEEAIPDTILYTFRGFTVEKDYSWSIEGAGGGPTSAGVINQDQETAGQFYEVVIGAGDAGEYTIGVDGPEYSGTYGVNAVLEDDLVEQAGRYFGTFATVVGIADGYADADSTVSETLNDVGADSGPYTVLQPTTGAFLRALDANGNGELDQGEIPAPGVLRDILLYHVVQGDITSSDISNGDSAPTLLPAQSQTFNVSGDDISVGPATVTKADIPATNGTIHLISEVLIPDVASADFQDQDANVYRPEGAPATERDTSFTVAGAYLPDGGFLVIHEQDGSGNAGPVVGNSEYLEPGFTGPVEIEVDGDVSDGVYGAMPHTDDGDETYEFPILGQDGPYTLDGDAVIDYGEVTIPVE